MASCGLRRHHGAHQAAPADALPSTGTAAPRKRWLEPSIRDVRCQGWQRHHPGRFGDDIYIYRTGYGNGVIVEVDFVDQTDTVKLRDLNASQITTLKSGNDLVIWLNATGERLTVKDQFSTAGTFGIEQIAFADHTTWNRATIGLTAGFAGTDLADSLLGGFGTDVFAGLSGNDTIDGAGGTDTVLFGGSWRDYAITYEPLTQTFTLSDRRAGAPTASTR